MEFPRDSGLDRKISEIPKPWGLRSGFENPEKIPSEKSRKSRGKFDKLEKIPSAKSRKSQDPGDRGWNLKIPKNPRKSRKNLA